MQKMSKNIYIGGESSFTGFFFGFFVIFVILYSMWYFSGGPQKSSSDKAFVEQPTYQNPYTFENKYGTVPEADKLNRQINQ